MNSPLYTSQVSEPVKKAVKGSLDLFRSISSHPHFKGDFTEVFFMFLVDLNKHIIENDWGLSNEEHLPLYGKLSDNHYRLISYFCEEYPIGSNTWTLLDEMASSPLREYILSSKGEYKLLFAELYSHISILRGKRDGSSYGIPRELMNIVNFTLEYNETDEFYSPFSCGIESLIEMPLSLNGEIGSHSSEVEVLTVLATTVFNLSFKVSRYEGVESALKKMNRSEITQPSKVLMFPPLAVKLETSEGKTFSDTVALEAAYQSLTQHRHVRDTKLVIISSLSVLFRGDKRSVEIRKKLIESGFIESVTQLPENLLKATSIPLVLIVLSGSLLNQIDRTATPIRFIDASSFKNGSKLDFDSLVKVFNEPPIRGISADYRFREDDTSFDLSVIRKTTYVEPLSLDVGYSERKLEDVAKLEKSRISNRPRGKWVNSSDFPKDGRATSFNDVEVVDMKQPRRIEVNMDALLVSVNITGDPYNIALFKYIGDSIYVGRSILVLSIKDAVVLIEWLAWELRSERSQTQMFSFSNSSPVKRLQWSYLKDISLAIPSLEAQRIEISKKEKEFDKRRAKEAGLEVYTNKIKQGYLDSLSITKHNLVDALSVVKPKLNLLHKILERDQYLKADEMIGDSTTLDYVKSVHDGLLTLGEMVHDLGDHEILKTKGSVNLIKSLRKLSKELSSERLEVEIDFFFVPNTIPYYRTLLKREDLYVGVDEANFQLMIRQIAKNALDHGGKPQVKLDFIISIIDEAKVSLLCANDGEEFVPSMTLQKFVTNGLTLGQTGNTGRGGYILNQIMQSAHGEVRIHNLKHISERPDEYCLIDHCERARNIAMAVLYEETNTGIELIFPIIEA